MLDAKYYRTEGVPGFKTSPQFINECLSVEEWRAYVADYDFGSLPPSRLILHHTWSPTVESWRGLTTMRSMQKYYAGMGWNAGPHIYVAPDGIWLATPMNTVGIHANAGNGGYAKGKLAWYSIGVEMVGNYDKVKPSGAVWSQTLEVFGGLVRRLSLPVSSPSIDFHRTYNTQKSCPGWAVNKPWVYSELNAWLASTNLVHEGLTVVAPPRITEDRFVQVLTEGRSPAVSEARQCYRIFVSEGVDPAVGLAIFFHESELGREGLTATFNLKNWGNVRTPQDKQLGQVVDIPGRGNFAKYTSWSLAVLDWCKRIKGPLYAGSGLHTVETILHKYAPESDGNAPTAYIAAVLNLVAGWQTTVEADAPYYVKATTTLNIRQGAHRNYPSAGKLRTGERVLVQGRKDEGDPDGPFLHLVDHRGFICEKYTARD